MVSSKNRPDGGDEIENDALRIEAPVFSSVVSLAGITDALVSNIWIYNRESKESHHVLSQVDLIPSEIPIIDKHADWSERLANRSNWRAYSISRKIEASKAIEWYEQFALRGIWLPSWYEYEKCPTHPVELGTALCEPRWPTLVTREDAVAVPFARLRRAGTWHHHSLVEKPAIERVLSSGEKTRLLRVLVEKAQVDLTLVPELWQSCHLFQPRPVLRYVGTRLDFSEETGERAVLVDIVPRKGAKLDGITIELEELRATGKRLLARFQPRDCFYRLPLTEDVGQLTLRVYHDSFGLLMEQGPYAFLRRIDTNIGLVTRERRPVIPAKGGQPEERLRIPITQQDNVVSVGRSQRNPSGSRVLMNVKHRLKSTSGPESKQQWFEDREPARKEIRRILSGARERALIVDPFFSADEVLRFLPVVANQNARLQVLTSSSGLRKTVIPESNLRGRQLELKQLERLRDGLRTAVERRELNATEVRVMGGKSSAIHDRFLLVDERVWLLGSSLNEFGSRGTMLVELPLPSRIVPKLDDAWNDKRSKTLDDAIARLESDAGGTDVD